MPGRRPFFTVLAIVLAAGWGVDAHAQATPPAAKPQAPAATQSRPPAPAAPATATPAAQAASQAASQAATQAAPNIPPTAPVITVQGFCEKPSTAAAGAAKPADCNTVITRGEFDKLAEALDPNMAPAARQSLADNYVKLLIVAADARRHGVEAEPRSQEVMRFVRMQVLANLYNQHLQQKARDVPPQEVESYYKTHAAQFDEATLRRVYIPKAPPEGAKKLSDAERATLAEGLQKRAAAGEDFDKLQHDAYTGYGITTPPPPSSMGPQRHGSLPQAQENVVFNLKPGEVSAVISDNLGDFIYKLESKRTLPLETVRAEIQRLLAGERYQQELGDIFGGIKAQLNADYFGSSANITFPAKPAESPQPAAPPKPGAGEAPKTEKPNPPNPK